MKRVLAWSLAVVMLLCMVGCAAQQPGSSAPETTLPQTTPQDTTPPESTAPEAVIVPPEAGTRWNAVEGFHQEEDPTSVWQYYFFDPQDSSYNLMQVFVDHVNEDIHSWYPWESSWVGVGFNNAEFCDVYGPGLEQNADGPSGMVSVIGFVAPADGTYVVTGKLMNAMDQSPDVYTVLKEDGTVVVSKEFRDFIHGGYTYLTPTDVTLKAGEKLYFRCNSTSDWVSTYTDLTVYYAPVDASVYEAPADYMPEPEPTDPPPAVEGAAYSSVADFSSENNDGVWVYASTTDGLTYTLTTKYEEPDWTGDAKPDAAQWYSANGTGMGFNYDVADYLELNVSETPENGGEIMALGFKAPAAGTYHLTVFAKNFWGQSSNGVIIHRSGSDLAILPFLAVQTQATVDLTLEEGEIVYIHGTSAGGWVSTYVAAFVTVD